MQKYLLFLFLFLVYNISNAQHPEIAQNFQKKLIPQKATKYQQLQLCEQQMTSNQKNFDVKYYSLDLTLYPSTSNLKGVVKVVGEIVASTLDYVELNFWDGMSISDVHISDSPNVQLNYLHTNNLLNIKLDKEYKLGEKFSLKVSYRGKPQNYSGSPFVQSFGFDSHNGEPMIWTFSQPFSARSWWPCKDIPSDKADSVDIKVTVPKNLIVASNGSLRETVVEGDNITFWWHEKYPISTYLVSLAIYPYTVYYDEYLYNNNTDTMKIHFYVFPENYDKYYSLNAKVKEMITYFAGLFGEYPFVQEKYGHADYIGHSGGMEHQTCTSIGSPNEGIFAHELAHQWWGDMITCDNYHHLWLNEGFAVYSHALWWTHAYPLDYPTASEVMMKYFLYMGPGTVYAEHQEDAMDNAPSYIKGAWILHMLRHIVGDNIFFDILKTFRSSPNHQYGTATTDDFQAICEQVSGMNLDKFFHQWIYEEYFPRYYYSWNYSQNGLEYNIGLEIEQNRTINDPDMAKQSQTDYIFWMPIDVTVTTEAGDTTFVVWDSLQTQTFQLSVVSKPKDIQLDKNNWIIKTIQKGTTGVNSLNEKNSIIDYKLEQNFPNPFNSETVIRYKILKASKVKIGIYNVIGEEVAILIDENKNPGLYSVNWNGADKLGGNLPSGIYICRIQANNFSQIKKMALIH